MTSVASHPDLTDRLADLAVIGLTLTSAAIVLGLVTLSQVLINVL